MNSQNEIKMNEIETVRLTSTEQSWLISLSAYLSTQNGYPIEQLTLTEKNEPHIIESITKMLKRDYGISNKKDLIETLNWLCETQSSKSFMNCVKLFTREDLRQSKAEFYSNPRDESIEMISEWAHKHKWMLAHCGIKAFDIGRYVFLCRCAFTINLVSEQDVWSYLLPIGKMAQKLFTNWQEFATSYLVGRAICYKLKIEHDHTITDFSEQMNKMNCHLKTILADEQHPWSTLDWKMTF